MMKINKAFVTLIMMGVSPILSNEGLYIGIRTGTSSGHIKIDKTERNFLKYSADTGKSGTTFGAFLGYNHILQGSPLFIGLEGGFNLTDLKMSLCQDHGILFDEKINATTKYSMHGVIKFGVVINDLMVYAKGGFFRSQWRLSFEGRRPNAKTFSKLIKTNSYGSVYGFGADYKVNKNWGIGLDHTVNTSQTLDCQLPNGSATISPVINTTSLRLSYHF